MRRSSSSIRAGWLILVLAGLLGLAAQAAQAEAVDDGASLMSQDQRAQIAEHHGYLLQDYDIDYRVVTAEDVGDISHFAVLRFAELGVGEASATGRGLHRPGRQAGHAFTLPRQPPRDASRQRSKPAHAVLPAHRTRHRARS